MLSCPSCKSSKTFVIDSRQNIDGFRRRRECKKCGIRFSTIEVVKQMKRGRKPANLAG